MAQATSPSISLPEGSAAQQPDQNNHVKSPSNPDVPIDPSISQASPTYPPYSPYGHEQGMHQGYAPPQQSGYLPPRPPHEQWGGYPQHGMPAPYPHPGGVSGPPPSAGRPGQVSSPDPHPDDVTCQQDEKVYSFVPIPGAQQHKRPRRRYEEIERMYKCGWNGCEKAYGTLNHLNAHVTMQSHGTKRTPEGMHFLLLDSILVVVSPATILVGITELR
jgi:transcription factor CON7